MWIGVWGVMEGPYGDSTAWAVAPEKAPREAHQIAEQAPRWPAKLNRDFWLEVKPARTVVARYSLSIHAPHLEAQRWLIFAAQPPECAGQAVRRVTTTPSSRTLADLSPLAQPLRITRFPVRGSRWKSAFDYQIECEVELSARVLRSTSGGAQGAAAPQLSDAERIAWLLPTAQFNYIDESFRAWQAARSLTRRTDEGEIDFARRVFQILARELTYEYLGDQDRCASFVCQAGKSDCGGMAILYASVLRSQGIPARARVGRWAQSAVRGQTLNQIPYHQAHVKAEFFAQGVGWVPVDLSSAVEHDRSPARLRYFGAESGNFITFHFDAGLSFDTHYFGVKTMTFMQKPAYWASGAGNFDEVRLDEDWRVDPVAASR
ncbi:MAG: transglutaminase domain-containing protein [Planctomycetales bacterium]|nr:transglutaminase domain-containing protein [Planctomycetales bacterium]